MSELEELRWRVEELEGLLVERPALFMQLEMTARETELAGFLLSRDLVTNYTWNTFRGANYDGRDSSLHVYIYRLRRKFAPYGIEIKSNRTRGFYIEPADKERLRTLAAA